MTSTPSACMIEGDGDIIGPGVRFSVYIQCILMVIRMMFMDDDILESAKLGAITTFSLIISALIKNDTNYILLLLETYLMLSLIGVTILSLSGLVATYTVTGKKFKFRKIEFHYTFLISTIVCVMTSSYATWLFSAFKQRLPEECSGQIKYYWLNNKHPIDYSINTALGTCIFLLIIASIVSFPLLYFVIKTRESDYSDDSDNNNSKIPALTGLVINLFMSASLIVAFERTVQNNPITGIWEWGFGQILAMVLAVIDVLRALKKYIKKYIIKPKSVNTTDSSNA